MVKKNKFIVLIWLSQVRGWDNYIRVNFSRLFSFPTTFGINKETKGGMGRKALQNYKKLIFFFGKEEYNKREEKKKKNS